MLLAGDIGGTKTLLGLFRPGTPRPQPIVVQEFVTLDYDGLEFIIQAFLTAQRVTPRDLRAATMGVAGAITDQVAMLTNVPWRVDRAVLARELALERVRLLNDLEAMAYAIPVLEARELEVLQPGERVASGNIGIIAAGTGLGVGMLLHVDGRWVPGQSEGGHADFSPRTPRELEMTAALTRVHGRVSAEDVVSGPGLVNIYQFTHDAFGSEPFVTPSTT